MYGTRPTAEVLEYAREKQASIVDLRSDTISRPTAAMRQAMHDAELGDDVYGEDPTVKRLEEKAAKLLGKEAAIFVPTGTMGNLIAVLIHCDTRGCEMYCGSESHVWLHEQAGAAQIGGVSVSAIPSAADGSFDLSELEARLRSDWQHEPQSRLVTAENTINGKVLPQAWLKKLESFARSRGLKLHLDGARLWNASTAAGIPVSELVRPFDSVTFCLSKGLAAPAGSLLCGEAEFVCRARRVRKVLGGGMRQVGVLAAAGIVALDELVPRLGEDHRRAKEIARAIAETGSGIVEVDLETTHTNMVIVRVDADRVTAGEFIARLQTIKDQRLEEDRVLVRGLALTNELARFALYYEVTDEMTQAAIRKIRHVIKEFESETKCARGS